MKIRNWIKSWPLALAFVGGVGIPVWSDDNVAVSPADTGIAQHDLLFGRQSEVMVWKNKSGKVAEFSVCAVSNGRIACRMKDGRFGFTDVAGLDTASLEQLKSLGLRSKNDNSDGKPHSLDFGKSSDYFAWASKGGVTKFIAMCAADLHAAVFVDQNGDFYKCSWDSLDTENGKALLAKMLGPNTLQLVAMQDDAGLVASLQSALTERKSEYVELGKQYAGVTDQTSEAWFSSLVSGLSSGATGGLQWELSVTDDSQVAGAEEAFKKKLIEELLSTVQLPKEEFDELVAKISVAATIQEQKGGGGGGGVVVPGIVSGPCECEPIVSCEPSSGCVDVFECEPSIHRCRLLARLRCR